MVEIKGFSLLLLIYVIEVVTIQFTSFHTQLTISQT